MGLSDKEKKEREDDINVMFLQKNICNMNGEKDYVFISYKSDDWKIVLKEIVYRLVKEYGLNIYFDGDFKDNNPHWTTQFPENMESDKCKGVLVFLDDKYATSYATLMELMHSQFGCQDENNNYEFVRKPVIPINLVNALSKIDDASDTGLGKKSYFNGEKTVKNIKASDELKLFNDDFARGCDLKVINKSKKPYLKEKKLSKKLCSVVVEEVLKSINYNDNYYNGNLDGIVETIKSVCGKTVFGKDVIKVVIPPDGKTYRITGSGKSYDAFYRIGEEDKITILRGSKIKKNETYIPKKLLIQYERMITQDGYLLCDIGDLPCSTAAKVMEGVSTNGQELLNEKKLLRSEVIVSLNTLDGDNDNAVIKTTSEAGANIGGKIIGPTGLGGLNSDGEVQPKGSRTNKLSLKEMVENRIISIDDEVYVKGREEEIGILTSDGCILYENETISLNQYVLKVLGPGSRNAYIFVYHKKTGKLLDELR